MAGRHSAAPTETVVREVPGSVEQGTASRGSHGRSGRRLESGGRGGDDRGSRDSGGRVRGDQNAGSRGRRAHSHKKKRTNLVSNLLIAAGVVLLLASAGIWIRQQLRYHKQAKVNAELATYATIHEEESTEQDSGPTPPEVDWAGLKAINDEVVAWIQVPGTEINYPVYEAADNERYLRNTAMGEWSWGGQLFCDFACTRPGMVDHNTLVYGHHLLDGSMFNYIADMDDQAKFDAIETVWYVTEHFAYECEPLFLYYTPADDQAARTFTFANDEEFRAYMAERLGRAVTMRADAAQALGTVRHALSLITCNYYDGYGRTVLVCVPKDEAAGSVAATTTTDASALAGEATAEAQATEAPTQIG